MDRRCAEMSVATVRTTPRTACRTIGRSVVTARDTRRGIVDDIIKSLSVSRAIVGRAGDFRAVRSVKFITEGNPLERKSKTNRIVPNREEETGCLQRPYFIQDPCTDVARTPKLLIDPEFPVRSNKRLVGISTSKPLILDRISTVSSSDFLSVSGSRSIRHSLSRRSNLSVYSLGVASLEDISFAAVADPGEGRKDVSQDRDGSDRAASMFRLREDPPPRNARVSTEFAVSLKESDTVFMLELATVSAPLGDEEGKRIVEANLLYESELRSSKTVSQAATQTQVNAVKHRKDCIPRNGRANSSASVTVWDIYDTYEAFKRNSVEVNQEEIRDDDFVEKTLEGNKDTDTDEFNVRLLNSLMLMERLVVQRRFREVQLIFQGLLSQDPFCLQLAYNYSLTHLWTFSCGITKNRTVTSVCWSSGNGNILAVGYGKFKFAERSDGLVCIWNVKNPEVPERLFEFKDPVTCVTFSEVRPQILAVAFYSGLVLIVDIIGRSLVTKATHHDPLYYPVWQAVFYPHVPLQWGQCLITCSKSGRLDYYRKTNFFVAKRMISLGRPHGRIQGVHQTRKCFGSKTPSCSNPSAEVVALHPANPSIYLVGTSEGCVYVCSIYRKDHITVFSAHDGPVYSIQFNPFCSKVFLTCGGDWCVHVWAEGIYQPLLTLSSGMTAVQGALWSPLHSTVIVSISDTRVEVWDIRRSTVAPKSSIVSPTDSHNTVIAFSKNRCNLTLGDVDGNVHVIALSEMPFSAAFQDEVLAQSLRNCLVSRPELLGLLLKLGHPFHRRETDWKTRLNRGLDNLVKTLSHV